jgi:hypothetical protein
VAAARELPERPAFYAPAAGRGRDVIALLHPPYTAWHLSYVALGAAAAPVVHGDRLLAALGAFFLAVGIAAHALDELQGRPLRTAFSNRTLVTLAAVSLAGAVAIGVVGTVTVSWTIAPFVVVGAFLVLAYNLELMGGRFHSDAWFALAWGALPALTGAWAMGPGLHVPALLVVAACFFVSVAQRRLSTPVRRLRRDTVAVEGEQRLRDGSRIELTAAELRAAPEAALIALSPAMVLLAAGLVAVRL